MNIGLSDIISENLIISDMKAVDRWEAIDEALHKLVEVGKIKPEQLEAVTAVVRKRESSMSTGIGLGIGMPHASTDLIQEPIAVLGRSKKGIQFDSLDGQPVNLVVLLLVPLGQLQKHLHTVAGIARNLQNADFRQALIDAPDVQAMFRIIREGK